MKHYLDCIGFGITTNREGNYYTTFKTQKIQPIFISWIVFAPPLGLEPRTL